MQVEPDAKSINIEFENGLIYRDIPVDKNGTFAFKPRGAGDDMPNLIIMITS